MAAKTNKLKKDIIVNVGGKPVKISRIKGLKTSTDEGLAGDFIEDDDGCMQIRIDADLTGEALLHTCCHELLHAALHVSGHSFILEEVTKGLEEAIVRCVEYIYLPSLKELETTIKENT